MSFVKVLRTTFFIEHLFLQNNLVVRNPYDLGPFFVVAEAVTGGLL